MTPRLLFFVAIAAAVIGALIALGLPPLMLCVVGAIMTCFGIVAAACRPVEEAYPAREDDL